MGHAFNWTPGNHGKGIVTPEGYVHTWNVDRQDGSPIHQEYIEHNLGVSDGNPYTVRREYNGFDIGPEGRVYEGPPDIDKLDPRLVQTDKWNFQSAAQHRLGWRPGEYGKGLVHDGAVHTWGVGPNQDGSPTHPEYAEKAFGMNEGQYGGHMLFDTAFGIDPEGALNVFDDNGWSSHPENEGKVAAEATAVDPRLYVPGDSQKPTWSFLGVAKNDEKWQLIKMGMPVDEGYWRAWPKQPERALYHGTSGSNLESIMQHGLHPWDSPIAGGSRYGPIDSNEKINEWILPRPEHVYLEQDPKEARIKAKYAYDEHEEPVVFRIDPSKLNPQNISPDEDVMHKYWRDAPRNQDSHRQNEEHPSLGEYAEQRGWGNDPSETQNAINESSPIAHRGVIPPEALTPGRVTPFSGEWEPLMWPHTAALIGDMRDGWGRFAVTAPWESGQWGKGIYYPETGALQTWADDRTHLDVWGDDENYSQPGSAHHIVIRPNGSVHDQGAFDRDFGDAQSDVEGLQGALRELDPSLRLDASNAWDFGSTEPMEEEPSSVSRGEDGGSVHGVQTGTDYAGSL